MLKIYCVRDKVADTVICTLSSANDGTAIRENARALSQVAPLGDLELSQVADLDPKTLSVTPVPIRIVNWESYKFPENPVLVQKKEEKK